MKSKLHFIIIILITYNIAYSQNKVDSLLNLGNTYFKNGDFISAAKLWELAGQEAQIKLSKSTNYSYASYAFACAKDSSNSFRCLDIAINQFGFNDLPSLVSDEVFNFMTNSDRWKVIISTIKPVFTTNPKAVRIIDFDVINFWDAYDLSKKDPKNIENIYNEHYFNKGSLALQFYFLNKIGTVSNFTYMHKIREKYYNSIRQNTLKTGQFRSTYKKSFIKLKKIYPDAIFPPIYFLIGKLNSAGTVSSDGLILAIDQACLSDKADTTELSNWEKRNISIFNNLPHTVAHELIHYQQNSLASDTTLLAASIKEGMADFIGEVISGKTANERLLIYGQGKEKSIWNDFKKEMYLNRGYNWIANSEQETADKPADLGYWVGYKICQAYYEQEKNKKKAIYDMLHIQNYEAFLKQSNFDKKINSGI